MIQRCQGLPWVSSKAWQYCPCSSGLIIMRNTQVKGLHSFPLWLRKVADISTNMEAMRGHFMKLWKGSLYCFGDFQILEESDHGLFYQGELYTGMEPVQDGNSVTGIKVAKTRVSKVLWYWTCNYKFRGLLFWVFGIALLQCFLIVYQFIPFGMLMHILHHWVLEVCNLFCFTKKLRQCLLECQKRIQIWEI